MTLDNHDKSEQEIQPRSMEELVVAVRGIREGRNPGVIKELEIDWREPIHFYNDGVNPKTSRIIFLDGDHSIQVFFSEEYTIALWKHEPMQWNDSFPHLRAKNAHDGTEFLSSEEIIGFMIGEGTEVPVTLVQKNKRPYKNEFYVRTAYPDDTSDRTEGELSALITQMTNTIEADDWMLIQDE